MANDIPASPGPDIALRQSDAESMQRAMRGVTTGRATGMAHQEAERQLKPLGQKTYGGSTLLKPNSMKAATTRGCYEDNLADKREFRVNNDRASAGANGHLTGGNAEVVEKEKRGIE